MTKLSTMIRLVRDIREGRSLPEALLGLYSSNLATLVLDWAVDLDSGLGLGMRSVLPRMAVEVLYQDSE